MIIAIIVCTLIAITNCQKWIPGIAKTQRSERFIFVPFSGALDDKCDQKTRFQMRISHSMVCMMLMLLWIFISFTSGKLYIPRSSFPTFFPYVKMLCYIVFIIRVNALNETVKCRMLSICWWSAISNNQSWSMMCATVYAQHDFCCCYCPFYVERIRYISEKIQSFWVHFKLRFDHKFKLTWIKCT